MKIDYAHEHGAAEAYRRITGLLSELKERYADHCTVVSEEWDAKKHRVDFEIKIHSFSVSGNVQVTADAVTLEGKLPILARPLSGRIEKEIRSALDDLLA